MRSETLKRRRPESGLLLVVVLASLVIGSGCGPRLSDAMLMQAQRSGVYVQTGSELVEISRWGAYNLDGISQQVQFKFESSIPKVAGPVAFVANLPGAALADSQVYLLPSIDAGVWHKFFAGPGDTQPLSVTTGVVKGSVYKITPELPGGAKGYLCLWVKMGPGADDRLYAMQIG